MMSHEELFDAVLENVAAVEAEDPTVVVETVSPDDPPEGETAAGAVQGNLKVAYASAAVMLRNVDTHPLVLDLILLKRYGPEWMAWEFETLQLRTGQDFHTPTIADVNVEKLQAVKTLHLVDDFWRRWEVFNPCCVALNGAFADFDRLQAPTVSSCMIAVDIANRVRDDVAWSEEVKAYLGVVHRHDSVLCPQPPLSFVEVDTEGLPVDCAEVMRRWPEVRSTGIAPVVRTIEDAQLGKMLDCWAALQLMRERLRAQLPVLKHV